MSEHDLPSEPQQETQVLLISGVFDTRSTNTELRMLDGRVLRFPTALLAEGHFIEDGEIAEASNIEAGTTIPIIEETLQVEKRVVETGTVRLHKRVQEYQETLDEPLIVRTFDVERVALNRPVESTPTVRQEGEMTIYPLVEEQLVLKKQLILKEEVRITKRETERRDNQVVNLRRESLTVERIPANGEEETVRSTSER